MRLDRLTTKARDALTAAEAATRKHNHQEVTPLHLLEALLTQEGGLIAALIERAGVNPGVLRGRLAASLERVPEVRGGDTYIGRERKDLLDAAAAEADRLKDEYISTEHMLLAMLELDRSPARALLEELGLSRDVLERALRDIRGNQRVTSAGSGWRAPGSRIRAARSARSCSWARPASARPSWPGPWPSFSSTTSTTWCGWTCPNTWRSTPSRAS